jgi:SAM-dependent methyltransferase
VAAVAERAAERALPLGQVPCWGAAPIGPEGPAAAIGRADEAMYERRGRGRRAASGGRLILTREGQRALRGPGEDRGAPQAGRFAGRFSPEFDAHFRAAYAMAAGRAREFVALVAPEPGTAVVEVGAGSGRITIDGGLAERIGPTGQLLVTDPSGPQLQVVRARAQEHGLGWLRFLRAPAESLPLASGTADLALGAMFLHFTDAERAVREMARVVRPGGRVAVSAALAFAWPPFWRDVLQPVWEELARAGRPERHSAHTEAELRALLDGAGLRLERAAPRGPVTLAAPSAAVAAAIVRQVHMVPLLLRGMAEEAVAERLAALWDRYPAEAREVRQPEFDAVAVKPGA